MPRFSLRLVLLLVLGVAVAVTWWRVGKISRAHQLAETRANQAEQELELMLLAQCVSRSLNYPQTVTDSVAAQPRNLLEIDKQLRRNTFVDDMLSPIDDNRYSFMLKLELPNGGHGLIVVSNSTWTLNGKSDPARALLFRVPQDFDVRSDRLVLLEVIEEKHGHFEISDKGSILLHRDYSEMTTFESTYEVSSFGLKFKDRVAIPLQSPKTPLLKGEVIAIHIESGRFSFSIGADDGVESGQLYKVVRDGEPIAMGEVIETKPFQSLARCTTVSECSRIKDGDRVKLAKNDDVGAKSALKEIAQ